MDEIRHVIPPDEAWEQHEAHPECWCDPVLTYENIRTGCEVWTHRAVH